MPAGVALAAEEVAVLLHREEARGHAGEKTSLSFASGLRPSAISTPLGMPSPSLSAAGSAAIR